MLLDINFVHRFIFIVILIVIVLVIIVIEVLSYYIVIVHTDIINNTRIHILHI